MIWNRSLKTRKNELFFFYKLLASYKKAKQRFISATLNVSLTHQQCTAIEFFRIHKHSINKKTSTYSVSANLTEPKRGARHMVIFEWAIKEETNESNPPWFNLRLESENSIKKSKLKFPNVEQPNSLFHSSVSDDYETGFEVPLWVWVSHSHRASEQFFASWLHNKSNIKNQVRV